MTPGRRVDHTAIVVRDMDEALARYERIWGVTPSDRQTVPEQRVEVAFLTFGDTSLELISPLDADSGVARFLERNGESLHHVAFAVDDIRAELTGLIDRGIQVIDREPRRGAHGLIAFVHPRGTGGPLVELVQNDRPHGK